MPVEWWMNMFSTSTTFWNIWINNMIGFYEEMSKTLMLKKNENETEIWSLDTCWSISNFCRVQIKQKLKFGSSNIEAPIVHEGFVYDKTKPWVPLKKKIDVDMILMKKAAQVSVWDWYNFPTQQIVLTVTIQFAQPYQHVHPHHRNHHHHHHHHLYQTDTVSITTFFRTTSFTQSSSSLKSYFESHNQC